MRIGVISGSGAAMRERAAAMEYVRLAMPRRVYTQSHADHVIETTLAVHAKRAALGGMRMIYEPPRLRHFTCRFAPLAAA